MDFCNKKSDLKLLRYTLIELMVVLSVILILGALLIPALNNVRSIMLEGKCANNLKVNAAGHFNYLADNNQLMWYDFKAEGITPTATNPSPSYADQRWMLYVADAYTGTKFGVLEQNKAPGDWKTNLYDYPDNNYYCSANIEVTGEEARTNRAFSTYSNNRRLLRNASKGSFYYQGRLVRVPKPSELTMLLEAKVKNGSTIQAYTTNFSIYSKSNTNGIMTVPHDGRGSALFVDGHSELLEAGDILGL